MIKLTAPGNSELGSAEPFEWTTSEQEYTVEKGLNGETLYAKEIDLGALPDSGTKNVAHNISGLDLTKVFRESYQYYNSAQTLSGPSPVGGYPVSAVMDSTIIQMATGTNWGTLSMLGVARIIYAK